MTSHSSSNSHPLDHQQQQHTHVGTKSETHINTNPSSSSNSHHHSHASSVETGNITNQNKLNSEQEGNGDQSQHHHSHRPRDEANLDGRRDEQHSVRRRSSSSATQRERTPRKDGSDSNIQTSSPPPHPHSPRIFKHLEKCIEDYEKLDKLGEGTYGHVFKARHKETGRFVAIKKIKLDREKEGFPVTAIREITVLKALNHENIVRLLDVVTSKEKRKIGFYMVFEYIEHDLAGLIEARVDLKEAHIKSLMQQLLSALFHCHETNVLHRDIKASNLLVTRDGTLRVGDFGLSRFVQAKSNYTPGNRVITRWYRPPECLLGTAKYGPAVDMWSVGCVLAELLSSKPLFPGKDEVNQLALIFGLCGSPEEGSFLQSLKYFETMAPKENHRRSIKERFNAIIQQKGFSPSVVDLLDSLLELDPSTRPSATQCLDHEWFWTDPLPQKPNTLPTLYNCNEMNMRKRRRDRNGSAPIIAPPTAPGKQAAAQGIQPPSASYYGTMPSGVRAENPAHVTTSLQHPDQRALSHGQTGRGHRPAPSAALAPPGRHMDYPPPYKRQKFDHGQAPQQHEQQQQQQPHPQQQYHQQHQQHQQRQHYPQQGVVDSRQYYQSRGGGERDRYRPGGGASRYDHSRRGSGGHRDYRGGMRGGYRGSDGRRRSNSSSSTGSSRQ